MEDEFIGAVKIKDALFIGDKESSQDLDFLISSKVTHIINVAGLEVKDEWASIGVSYLTFNIQDLEDQEVDLGILLKSFEFIEKALDLGESVLVHSVNGRSRCVLIVLGYLMQKYQWVLSKALEFVNSRKPDCEIRSYILKHLVKFEEFLSKKMRFKLTKEWDLSESSEEVLMRNTFLNSKPGAFAVTEKPKRQRKTLIKWLDECEFKRPTSRSLKKIKSKIDPVKVFKENSVLKSCLKGENRVLASISKSMNNLPTKTLNNTSNLDDKKKTCRTSSVSKRENSPKNREARPPKPKKIKQNPLNFLNCCLQVKRSASVRRSSPLDKMQIENTRPVLKQIWRL